MSGPATIYRSGTTDSRWCRERGRAARCGSCHSLRLEFDRLRGQISAGVAGIASVVGLDQEHMRLLVGLGAVLDAAGHDEQLAGIEDDITVAQLDREPPGDD